MQTEHALPRADIRTASQEEVAWAEPCEAQPSQAKRAGTYLATYSKLPAFARLDTPYRLSLVADG